MKCKMEKIINKIRAFLRDIKIFENNQAEYTKCDNWNPAWYDKEYNGCPCIDCSVCIAKQALFIDNKIKNNLI